MLKAIKSYEKLLLNVVHESIVERAVMNAAESKAAPERMPYADVAANPGIRMDI